MKSKFRIVLLLSLVAALLLATACGSDTTTTKAPDGGDTTTTTAAGGDDTPEAVELGITWWGPDARHEATQAALDLYTTKNPHITFVAEPVAWDGFWDRLPTLVAAKNVPDVLQMDAAFIEEYVAQNALADITAINLDGVVDDTILENVKMNGVLYGVPLSHNAQGFAYHMPRVEEYGLTEPALGWTWDDYFDFAREAREKMPEDQWGITDSAVWDSYQYYQTANDAGPIFSENGTVYNLDKDLWMEWMQIHQEFRENNIVPPADIGHIENDPIADPMASGDVVVIGKSVGSVSALEQMMPGEVAVVNIPVGSSGKGGWAQSTIFLSVAENSEHKQEGMDFIQWFVSDLEAGEILGTTRGMPINDAVYEIIEPTLERKDTIGRDLLEAALPYALPFYPLAAGWTEWQALYESEVQAVQFGRQTLEGAYDNLQALADQIVASKLAG